MRAGGTPERKRTAVIAVHGPGLDVFSYGSVLNESHDDWMV